MTPSIAASPVKPFQVRQCPATLTNLGQPLRQRGIGTVEATTRPPRVGRCSVQTRHSTSVHARKEEQPFLVTDDMLSTQHPPDAVCCLPGTACIRRNCLCGLPLWQRRESWGINKCFNIPEQCSGQISRMSPWLSACTARQCFIPGMGDTAQGGTRSGVTAPKRPSQQKRVQDTQGLTRSLPTCPGASRG